MDVEFQPTFKNRGTDHHTVHQKKPQIQQRIVLILEVSERRKNSHKTKTNLFGGSVSSHDSEDHRLPLE